MKCFGFHWRVCIIIQLQITDLYNSKVSHIELRICSNKQQLLHLNIRTNKNYIFRYAIEILCLL